MARERSLPHLFDDMITAESARVLKELAANPPGPQREALIRKLRQLTIAAEVDKWTTSPGLQPPK